jgi:hypothetical protein
MCFADAGGVVVDAKGDLFEARGDAGDRAAGGDGVLAAHAAQEVQRAAGVLGQVADVLVVSLVDDAVQPALAGPGLDQREPGLGVVELSRSRSSRTISSVSGTAPSARWRSISVA